MKQIKPRPGLRRRALSDGQRDLSQGAAQRSRGGDSQLGNLVATAMRLRRRVETDFGLTNALGIRADFESGPLTLEQLYNVFPFDNTITTQFLSGDEMLQMFDFVAERSSGARLPHPGAGLGRVLFHRLR